MFQSRQFLKLADKATGVIKSAGQFPQIIRSSLVFYHELAEWRSQGDEAFAKSLIKLNAGTQ